MTTFLTFVLVLSTLILIHELGHFVAARLMKIKVEEFGLGLPPKLWQVWQDKDTKYTLNLLPIGGFVKLHGENLSIEGEENIDKERAFYYKSNLAKIFVLTAGVGMNLILGYILLMFVTFQLGVANTSISLLVQEINENSPASEVLKEGNLITGYRTSDTEEFTEVTASKDFVEFIKSNAGSEVEFKLLDDPTVETPEEIFATLTPRANPPEGEGALGVLIAEVPYVTYEPIEWWRIPGQTANEVVTIIGLMFSGLGNIITELVQNGAVPQDVAGPLGIAKITGEVAEQGFVPLIQFMAFISLNLAVINILPFPALDGGRLLFVVIETIIRRKINPKYETWIHAGGMLFLLVLVALISIYDFQRYFM